MLDAMRPEAKTVLFAVYPELKVPQNFSTTDVDCNFTDVLRTPEKLPTDPFKKPIGIPAPATLREARLSPWWPEYKKASQLEYDGLLKNKTWELVPVSAVPKGKTIIKGKWVFADRRTETGLISKFKARFVAMGFMQRKGVDFDETFAGVVVGKAFRTMLVILNEDMTNEMEHWDVKQAFTQAVLKEQLFMHQPENFETKQGFVCLLKKSLYGLKQAAKNWADLLREIFTQDSQFKKKFSDPCVYFKKLGDAWCIASTHVDDIFVLFNILGKKIRDDLFKKISARVEIDNLGPVTWALKTAIQRDRANGILKISQEAFITELLAKQLSSIPTGSQLTPTFENCFLPKNLPPTDFVVDETLKKTFQSQIGALWWLTSISRPDIYYAVHRCSKMQNCPTPALGKAIQKILQYLSSTKGYGIIYQRKSNPPVLSGFVDAAFGSEDENMLSRIGYLFLFRGNIVSWVSENPSRVMTSSTEAECRGLVHFAKENLWHRQFHKELNLYKIDKATVVFEDNQSAITMSSDIGTPHKRSKHFGIEFAFFKQSVELDEVKPVFVATDEQIADIFTKALLPKKFAYFRDLMLGPKNLQDHFAM
jgi:hypothetical protein